MHLTKLAVAFVCVCPTGFAASAGPELGGTAPKLNKLQVPSLGEGFRSPKPSINPSGPPPDFVVNNGPPDFHDEHTFHPGAFFDHRFFVINNGDEEWQLEHLHGPSDWGDHRDYVLNNGDYEWQQMHKPQTHDIAAELAFHRAIVSNGGDPVDDPHDEAKMCYKPDKKDSTCDDSDAEKERQKAREDSERQEKERAKAVNDAATKAEGDRKQAEADHTRLMQEEESKRTERLTAEKDAQEKQTKEANDRAQQARGAHESARANLAESEGTLRRANEKAKKTSEDSARHPAPTPHSPPRNFDGHDNQRATSSSDLKDNDDKLTHAREDAQFTSDGFRTRAAEKTATAAFHREQAQAAVTNLPGVQRTSDPAYEERDRHLQLAELNSRAARYYNAAASIALSSSAHRDFEYGKAREVLEDHFQLPCLLSDTFRPNLLPPASNSIAFYPLDGQYIYSSSQNPLFANPWLGYLFIKPSGHFYGAIDISAKDISPSLRHDVARMISFELKAGYRVIVEEYGDEVPTHFKRGPMNHTRVITTYENGVLTVLPHYDDSSPTLKKYPKKFGPHIHIQPIVSPEFPDTE